EADLTLRVDKKGAVHRQIVEVEKAIRLKNFELRIGQQRERKAARFLVRFQSFLEVVRRVGTDGDEIDPLFSKLAGLLRKTVELFHALDVAVTAIENHDHRSALVLTQRYVLAE